MVDKSKILFLNSSFIKSETPPATTDGKIASITIEGYASTNDADRQGDIVPASVWEKGISNYLKNPVILAGTAILAALMIFVSEMNLMC